MKKADFNWLIAGSAGQGAGESSQTFARCLLRSGLHVHATSEFPSLIRGGHNYTYIRVSEDPVPTHREDIDMILALNQNAVSIHAEDLNPDGILIYDPETMNVENIARKDITLFPVQLKQIAMETAQFELAKNIVGLGATLALIKLPIDNLLSALEQIFGKKGSEIVRKNQDAARAGYDFAAANRPKNFKHEFRAIALKEKRVFVSGNEAISIGAIKGGCKFVAEYPMTPSTSILHFMAAQANEYSIVVKHTEDEIAAANMLAGAGFAGARSLTGTSGGGFSLMSEALGLAVSAEIPMVIVDSQRGGPSTGLPTRTEQADLNIAYYTTHGDAPRFVVAPGDQEEAFYMMHEAMNLAEKYQSPVIFMSDKYLSEGYCSFDRFRHDHLKIDRGKLTDKPTREAGKPFKRYCFTEDGVSSRVIPGTPDGIHRASGYENDEYGVICEDPINHKRMVEKRARKLKTALDELKPPTVYGPQKADISLISWGSTKGAIIEALELLKEDGIAANFMHIRYIQPMHTHEIAEFMSHAQITASIECNHDGQLTNIIRHRTHRSPDYEILKYDSRPITQMEIANSIKEILSGTPHAKSNVEIRPAKFLPEKTQRRKQTVKVKADQKKITATSGATSRILK